VLTALWLSCVGRLKEERNYDVYPASLQHLRWDECACNWYPRCRVWLSYVLPLCLKPVSCSKKIWLTVQDKLRLRAMFHTLWESVHHYLFIYNLLMALPRTNRVAGYLYLVVRSHGNGECKTLSHFQVKEMMKMSEKAGMCILIVMGCKVR
jgi:hypothetical protein